jgi:mannose-1-phosphate guanylyltransferase
MILAAGLGTRLLPLTRELPKPLAWLGDRPQIDHAIAALARAGLERVVVNTHHLADKFDETWRRAQPIEVALVHEEAILGTAGGVANAAAALGDGDVLVWNADIVADLDVARLLDAHAASGAASTLVVGPQAIAVGQGSLGLDARGDVVRLRAHRGAGEVRGAEYAGIALISSALRARLPAPGCLVADGWIPLLQAGGKLATHALRASFLDTGTKAEYLEANLAWLADRGASCEIAPGALVEPSVELDRVVVAAGARVVGTGALRRVVVWPGATATAPLEDAVVTREGVVRI